MTRRSQDAIVESGHFRVEAGKLVLRDVVERGAEEAPSDLELTGQTGLPEKDVCHNDDLIIDGSLCVGFDCVCNQAFGFDTIILKENNLRIYFDDTSTTASFPRNDWRIIANDSTNGGASYFGIQDATANRTVMSIEAGARSNALYVEDDGDIGVGTSTPAVDIHVVTGNTPTLRLAQDGSSGFSPQTWDVAGNETNFFIRDATFGSKLPFRIRPGAPTSAVDIASDGDVGVGEASPDGPLHVRRTTSGAKDMLILENNGPTRIALDNTASAGSVWRFNHADNGDFRFAADDGDVEFALGQDGTLTLDGGLITGTPAGTCNPGPCDGVFQPDYEVESIEDHAAFMWENSYLWGVGPTREGEPMNITKKTAGILHELEKAHIYIEQLHDQLREKDAELESVQERLDRIEALLVSLATTR